MTQATTTNGPKDMATIYQVFQHASKLQLDDFVDVMDAKPVPAAVLSWMKEVGATVTDRKALARAKGKRAAAKKKQANELTLNGKDKTNDFGLWYSSLKERAERYFQRVVDGLATLNITEPGKIPPWEKEKELDVAITQALQANLTPGAVLDQLVPECQKLHLNISNMKLRALLSRVEIGAYFTALHRHLVLSGKMTMAAFAQAFQADPSTLHRSMRIYALIKNYNLLLYTGETYTNFSKWHSALQEHFQLNPSAAFWWQGGGLHYIQQRISPQFNPTTHFVIGDTFYGYSEDNLQRRQANEERMSLPEEEVDLDELMDTDEPDDVTFQPAGPPLT